MAAILTELYYTGPDSEPHPNQMPLFLPALEDRLPDRPDIDQMLKSLMARYVIGNVLGDKIVFEKTVCEAVGSIDAAVEGYTDGELARQRDLSVKFHWGHDHDFGSFTLEGRMGLRHITLMKNFLSEFSISPDSFGCDVLDVGCWTGGTTLLLAALGARVTAVEEVIKYARMTRFLLESFGIAATVIENSIYNLDQREAFDIVYIPGVIYHLSDPLVGIRIIANSLRIGGSIFIESEGINITGSFCRYEGSAVFHSGSVRELSRGGWNWFCFSPLALARLLWAAGFDEIRVRVIEGRIYAVAKKLAHNPITRAGLSRPCIP